MIEARFAQARLAETHQDLVRNIVALQVTDNPFDDLSDEPAAWAAAARLVRVTQPPRFTSVQPVIDRPFEAAAWDEALGYPFRHWMRSRYSDGSFGLWYGADTIETSVQESVHHWRAGWLGDAGFTQPGIEIARALYRVRLDAALVDLRPAAMPFPSLVAPDDTKLTQAIGARLHQEGHPGLVSRSARGSGDVYALLNPRVLSDPRPIGCLTYRTTVSGVAVEREPGTVWLWVDETAEKHPGRPRRTTGRGP